MPAAIVLAGYASLLLGVPPRATASLRAVVARPLAKPAGDWGDAPAPRGLAATLPTPRIDATEVHAGDRVVLRWPSLASQAEELELVFSIDDGRHYDVRVSPELHGGECRYVWRVPNVSVREARVRLRARIDGRELSGSPTAPFRIHANPLRAAGRWSYRNGEWWEDSAGVTFDLPGLITPARGPSLHAGCGVAPMAAMSRTLSADPPVRSQSIPIAGIVDSHDGAPAPQARVATFRPIRE